GDYTGTSTEDLVPDVDASLSGSAGIRLSSVHNKRGAGDESDIPADPQQDQRKHQSHKAIGRSESGEQTRDQQDGPSRSGHDPRTDSVHQWAGDQRRQPHGTDVEANDE